MEPFTIDTTPAEPGEILAQHRELTLDQVDAKLTEMRTDRMSPLNSASAPGNFDAAMNQLLSLRRRKIALERGTSAASRYEIQREPETLADARIETDEPIRTPVPDVGQTEADMQVMEREAERLGIALFLPRFLHRLDHERLVNRAQPSEDAADRAREDLARRYSEDDLASLLHDADTLWRALSAPMQQAIVKILPNARTNVNVITDLAYAWRNRTTTAKA